MQLGVRSAMSADEFRNVMLNGYAWRRFHGHGRHEAAMGSNPDIGETTERLTLFGDQAAEPTAHHRTVRAVRSVLGSPRQEAHDEAYLENIRT